MPLWTKMSSMNITLKHILLDEEYDGTQNDAYAYNSAMHSFPNPTDPENV